MERDLEFEDRDFQRIRELIYRRAGIVLAQHKRDMVYSRVGRRVRHHHMRRFRDYLTHLESHPGATEWEEFTNSLTTNLTAFFREPHHFPLLVQHAAARRGPVRVWSAAASTGQEPYSVAMALVEALGEQAAIEVVGTDVDTHALEVARNAIYPMKQIESLDETRRKRFFHKGSGSRNGLVRLRPELVARVGFRPLNLVADKWDVDGRFDAIFCRNVMIYFDAPTQLRILERFARFLKPDGLLFAGHSESFTHMTHRYRLRGQTVYTLTPDS